MSSRGPSIPLGARALRAEGIPFTEHLYDYLEKGGTSNAARQLDIEEHAVVKTLVMKDDQDNPLIVLMHGDRQVSTKNLARAIGSKRVFACSPEEAHRHTGYQVGGISPLGTRKPIPIHMERTILDLSRIYINAGRRGFLVGVSPKDLCRILCPVLVDVAV